MKLPGGCGELSGKYVDLEEALYGLKQSGLLWNDLLVDKLVSVYGMEQCMTDPRVSSDPGGQTGTDLGCACRRHGCRWH